MQLTEEIMEGESSSLFFFQANKACMLLCTRNNAVNKTASWLRATQCTQKSSHYKQLNAAQGHQVHQRAQCDLRQASVWEPSSKFPIWYNKPLYRAITTNNQLLITTAILRINCAMHDAHIGIVAEFRLILLLKPAAICNSHFRGILTQA